MVETVMMTGLLSTSLLHSPHPPRTPPPPRLGTVCQHRHDKYPCSDFAEKPPIMYVCMFVSVRLCVPAGSFFPKGL
jgi:hypothetical protein